MAIAASPELDAGQPRDNALPKGKRVDLIECVAETLHAVKAYDLPAVCERLGLSEGNGSEAHASKRAYVRSRLQGLNNHRLLQIAREVEQDYSNFSLSEFLRLLDEADRGSEVTELTRRSILKTINGIDLFGDLPLVEHYPFVAVARDAGLGFRRTEPGGIYLSALCEERRLE
jgi:hypothetical protein